MKALIIDDDFALSDVIAFTLRRSGFETVAAYDGNTGLERWQRETPDLVILDLNLPGRDGLSICRAIRRDGDTPIIILSVRDDEEDIVAGLRLGADDYMVKPFSGPHLDARVTSVLRRTGRASRAEPTAIQVGALRIDVGQRIVQLDNAQLELTRKEFDLLAYLAARPGKVVSRRELLEEVWRQPSIGEDQTIDVHLYWLRRKLGESAAKPRYLHTVRGVGLRLVAPD